MITAVATAVAVVGVTAVPAAADDAVETRLDADTEYSKLEPLEAHMIDKADKAFGSDKKGSLRLAVAEYDHFILKNPRSAIIPYAILRKGRSLHRDGKRFEAIDVYQEVLDYFPNDVKYAAAALYRQGQAHWENGHEEKAIKAWASMADDKDYAKHPFAAIALNNLADALWDRDQRDAANKYRRQLAKEFRTRNSDQANEAIDKVVQYYVRFQPSEPDLRAFYKEVRTFHDRPRDVDADLDHSRDYWNFIRDRVGRFGNWFGDDQQEQRKGYFAYWVEQMGGKFPDWDEYQIDLAGYQLAARGDRAAWVARIDDQFERGYEEGDWGRITTWIKIFRDSDEKIDAYYQKYNFAKMPNAKIIEVIDAMYDIKKDEVGQRVFRQVRLDELKEPEKLSLAKDMLSASRREEHLGIAALRSMEDRELADMTLLRYYANGRIKDTEKGIPLARQMMKSTQYANEATRHLAELLHWDKQYQEAIAAYAAYQPADKTDAWPFYRIAECQEALGKVEAAVQQLREIENYYVKEKPRAAFEIAMVYKRAKNQKQYVGALYGVMNKYPKSGESSRVHNLLEDMGLDPRGGIDEAE